MTFAQLMDDAKASTAERQACAWHLAQYRMRRTLETLLPIKVDMPDRSQDAKE